MKGNLKKFVSAVCVVALLLGLFTFDSGTLKAEAAANTITYTSSNPLVLRFNINSSSLNSGYWYMAEYLAPDTLQYPADIVNLSTSVYNPFTQSVMNLGSWSYPALHNDYRGTLTLDNSFGFSFYFDDQGTDYMEAHYTGTIYQDTQPPSISLSSSGWSNTSVTVTANVTDSGSGVAIKKWAEGSHATSDFDSGSLGTTFSGNTFSVTVNDDYTVYAKDVAGNETSSVIYVDTFDNTPPSMTLSEYAWSANNETVQATIADNGSGVAIQKYASGSQTASYFTGGGTAFTGNSFVVTANGTYTVYACDNAGNTTQKTINVSHIGTVGCPVINYTASAPFDVPFIYYVNEPGGAIYPWPNDFPQTLNYPGDIEAMSPLVGGGGDESISPNIYSMPTLQNGYQGKLTYTGIVGGGQMQQFAIRVGAYVGTIYQDTTPPNIQLQESDWAKGSCSFIATVSDSGSGMATQKWAQGSQAASYFSTGGTTFTSSSINVTSNSVYTVYAEDNAGNEAIKTITVDHIDNTAPSISLAPQSTWGQINTVTAAISDSQSGLKLTKWAEGSQSAGYFASNGNAFNGSFSVQADDTYTVYAVDNVGNAAVQTVVVNHIDVTAPTAAASLSPNTETSGNVTVTVTASDAQSGVESIQLPDGSIVNSSSATYAATSNGLYNFVITDHAGNQMPFPVAVSNIVKTISITHPITLSYSIDPNGAPVFNAPDLTIINNSDIPVSVAVNSFTAVSGGTLTMNDVDPNKYSDWDTLTKAQTQSDIALALQVKETETGQHTWENIFQKTPLYAISTHSASYAMGILNAHGTGNLALSCKSGLAWDAPYSVQSQMVLEFDAT